MKLFNVSLIGTLAVTAVAAHAIARNPGIQKVGTLDIVCAFPKNSAEAQAFNGTGYGIGIDVKDQTLWALASKTEGVKFDVQTFSRFRCPDCYGFTTSAGLASPFAWEFGTKNFGTLKLSAIGSNGASFELSCK